MIILICCFTFLVLVAIHDVFIQKKHTIQHNFPVVGHIRYWLETIGPELRQYIVANDQEETPFNRDERRWVYASSKKQNNYFGFGSTDSFERPGHLIIKNSIFSLPLDKQAYMEEQTLLPCLKSIGESHKRKNTYQPTSIINLSGMSFGALGKRATSALNLGAKHANCYHNTGEGSISPYHLYGADIMLQIGTAYFGTRNEQGEFDLDALLHLVKSYPQIRLIEIKLSQGAKPGKGGVLPAKKITKEISKIRGIPLGQDCISPNAHSAFHDISTLLDFIETIANATGLPVGIKCAVGRMQAWEEMATKMKFRRQGPDFITIDGGEGGTGAAPLTYTDHVSLPFTTAFSRVYQIFQRKGIAQDIVWIGSGKLGFPDRVIVALAMGCDIVHLAREAMLSIGCIQAQKCHTGHCPTGIATQNSWLESGININDKAKRFTNYINTLRGELISLSHTAGYTHPNQFTMDDIEFSTGMGQHKLLSEIAGYRTDKISPIKQRNFFK